MKGDGMYCPKCGNEALESQKFCKSCGTNLQLIYGALDSNYTNKGPFGLDMEALARNAREFSESWKSGWEAHKGSVDHWKSGPARMRAQIERKAKEPRVPRPKEWLSYSWQHSLRNGLITLFGGLGLGAVLFYLGRVAINEGTLRSIEEATQHPINGLERLISLLWLFALIPVLKGVAQIIYACFADSISTLTAKFLPQTQDEPSGSRSQSEQYLPQSYSVVDHDTAPQTAPGLDEAPPSVTEHTTRIIKEGQPGMRRETQ